MNQPVPRPAALGTWCVHQTDCVDHGDHGACEQVTICVANRLRLIGFESGQRHRASKPALSADLPTKYYTCFKDSFRSRQLNLRTYVSRIQNRLVTVC